MTVWLPENLVMAAVVAGLFAIVTPALSRGGQASLPLPGYSADELAKVREWERKWAGKQIDTSNVDAVADYIPETYKETIKHPEKWGRKPTWFRIVPYRQVVPTRGFTEATRKNAGKIKMDEDMVPVGYEEISGFPFPEPKTGWELAWNYDFNNRGDSLESRIEGVRVDPLTRTDSTSVIISSTLWFASRTEAPPKPRVPDRENPRGFRWSLLMHFEHPQVVAGSRVLNHRYLDMSKKDESYQWSSEFRRVTKVVASQKLASDPGLERCVEDQYGFFNHITVNDYKLLGRKDLLVARHVDPDQWVRVSGQYLWSGIERERVNTYVVEAIPKDRTHVYSKRIWYVDPEDFFIRWAQCYDRDGRLWRSLENQYGVYKNVNGEDVSFFAGTADVDRKGSVTATLVHRPLAISGPIDPGLFTLAGMRKTGY
jgi:hypothetical protein